MTITPDVVTKLAHLARIALDDADNATVMPQIASIFTWFETLNTVDVRDVLPLDNPHDAFVTPTAGNDSVTMGGDPKALLSNAPAQLAEFFKVPKVVE